jgi:hypothetical protein
MLPRQESIGLSEWHLERLPGDVRQEAENAAQREGLPLHRWLAKTIRDTCVAEGIAPARGLSRVAHDGVADSNGARAVGASPRREAMQPLSALRRDQAPQSPPPATEPHGEPLIASEQPAETPAATELLRRPASRLAARLAEAAAADRLGGERMNGRSAESPWSVTARPAMQSTAAPPPPPAMPEPPSIAPPSRISIEPRRFTARAAGPASTRAAASPATSSSGSTSPAGDRQTLLAQLVQSLQRNELSPLGEARIFLKLMTEHMASIGDITVATGRTRDQVSRSLRLLGLSDRLRDLIDKGGLSREQAYALLDGGDPEAMLATMQNAAAGRRAP